MEKSQIEKIIEAKVKQIGQDAFNLDELIEILKSNPNIDWKWFEKLYNNFIKPIIGKCKAIQDLIKEAKVKERKTTNNSIDEKLDLILNGVHSLDARVAKVEVDMAVVKGDMNILKTDMIEVKGDINVLKNDMVGVKGDINVLKTDMVEVKGDINVLKTDMVGVKGDINVLKTDMVGVKGDIEVVKDSVNRLENGFSNLKDHFGIDFLKKKK